MSLVSLFWQKNPTPGDFFFFFGGGGGGGGGEGHQAAARYEHESPHVFFTLHIVTISSTELYSLMEIFLMVFKIEGIVA